jgi:hypothetical protein
MSSADGSDDLQPHTESMEGSILEEDEPQPQLRRVSSSSSNSSESSLFEPDEAGLITSRSRPPKDQSPASNGDLSHDASTIVKALDADLVEEEDDDVEALTPRDANRVSSLRKSSNRAMQSSANSTKDKIRQNLTLREQEKVRPSILLSIVSKKIPLS